MFEYKYKDEMDNIRPDDYIKQKVLNNIKKGEKAKKTVANRITISAITAVAASFALVFSIFGIGAVKNNVIGISNNSSQKQENYDEVYSVLENTLPKNNGIFGYITDKIVQDDIVEYEMIEEETAAGKNDVNGGVAVDESKTQTLTGDVTDANNAVSNKTHSETTTQVDGVKEADVVKTDGEYIYSISFNTGELRIIKAGKAPKLMSITDVAKHQDVNLYEMYLVDENIVVLGEGTTTLIGNKTKTSVFIYDVSNPDKPKLSKTCEQSGRYNDSRLIGDKLYLISDYTIQTANVKKEKPETFVPKVASSNFKGIVSVDDIIIDTDNISPKYTVVCGYSVNDGKLISTKSILGGVYTVYCSTKNIIIAGYSNNNVTNITRLSIADGNIKFEVKGEIEGSLLNQFSIDEYNGNFRFVTTKYRDKRVKYNSRVSYETITVNSLVVLDGKLKEIGSIGNVAPEERVYSVRFMGDIAYFVTFRETDPLFSVDLSNPKKPKIIGKLKIPGFSNYLFPFGDGKLLGIGEERDEYTGANEGVKLSMFDISDPSDVSEISKEVLNTYYSEALYDHKAILVDNEKNIIGFSADGDNGLKYLVFRYEKGKFKQVFEKEFGDVYGDMRGIYISDEFYIITDDTLYVYNVKNFEKITQLSLI